MLCIARAHGAERELVIRSARLIDVRHGVTSVPVDIYLHDNRIASIHDAGSSLPSGVRTLDARGLFVAPGYWDMHVHVNGHHSDQWMLPMFVAAGVTGVRDMSGDCVTPGCTENLASMRALQERVSHGEQVGPRILAIASAQVDGPRELQSGAPAWSAPGTPEAARTLVRKFKARGVDFIKPYNSIPRETYFELLRAASAAGLRLSGHVPLSVTTLEAVEGGQLTIEHAVRPALDCAGYADVLHEEYEAWASGRAKDSPNTKNYAKLLESFDERRCDRIIAGIGATRAWYVPTQITRRFEAYADEKAFTEDSRLRFVPREVLAYWQDDIAGQRKRFAEAPAQKAGFVGFYELTLRLTGKMHAAGVPVLVGSDALDSYCFPGSSLHDELLELRKAGLSNAAVMRAATLSAAEFLGREAEFGTVEAGKMADLVLLRADPLVDIANAAKVEAVVLNGRLFTHQALIQLQDQVEAYVRTAQ
jgi:hypothetical protein